MMLNQLAPYYKYCHYCFGDEASPEERKKGNTSPKLEKVYPAFPWKMDGTDHSADDPRLFTAIAAREGQVNYLMAEHISNIDELITYEQWVEMNKDNPNWVNQFPERKEEK